MRSRGWGALGAAVLLLFLGFRFGYPDLAVLGGAAAAALLGAAGFALWQPRLRVRRAADPDRVARGAPARMTLTVHNAGRVPASLVAVDRCDGRDVPVPLLRLRPGRDTVEGYPVPTHRRGVVPVGPLRVVRGDPLGLVSLARAYGDTAAVWVHPRIHPLRAVPAGLTRSLDGRVDKVPHGTITFDSLREYVAGDELRRVHWRSSAKAGTLMVREQLDTSEPSLVVLLDDRSSAHAGESFEESCEAAASIVAAAVREDVPVQLHLVSGPGRLPTPGPSDGAEKPKKTRLGAGPFLDVLTEATLRPGDLSAKLRQLRAARPGDTLVFLTGPGGRGDLGAVGGLRGAYPVVVAGLFGDPDAAPMSPGDGMILIEAASGAEFAAAWDGVRGW